MTTAEQSTLRQTLRTATDASHQRLHGHPGFRGVQRGSISRPRYRALLTRLYGFHAPFEEAAPNGRERSGWLALDLVSLGVERGLLTTIPRCVAIPALQSGERRLGAMYVVEGSAIGGRTLARGLDRMLGPDAIDGRRFFLGRGGDTGDAWGTVLAQLEAVSRDAGSVAAVVGAAVETFSVFEDWLSDWNTSSDD